MTFRVREPQPGEILGGNYLIEKELGRGGFGVVFKARHIEIERVVAIKVLLATYASRDPTAKDRFRREATIAASLNYPNSLRVFDYGETDEGVFYLVMEFVAGKDLTTVIRDEGRFAPGRAIHVARQVLWALSEAHARGIVHRDIKPDNIMLSPLSYDRDFVKVMDFGIAKMVESESITQAGMTLGTPRYMPIEQLKGMRLAPSSDLYAVGLVIYDMVVGAPAFTGETAVDTALAVMRGDAVKVPDDAGVPRALAAVIEKASAKEPEDRYQSARELLDALEALHFEDALAPPTTAAAEPKPSIVAGHHGTLSMPEIDRPVPLRGDFDDVSKTITLDVESVSAPPKPSAKVDHAAATQTMPALASPPKDTTLAVTQGMRIATETSMAVQTPASSPVSPATQQRPGVTWLGASPLVILLQVSALVLLVLLLLK